MPHMMSDMTITHPIGAYTGSIQESESKLDTKVRETKEQIADYVDSRMNMLDTFSAAVSEAI
jgi:hypothetical protein